MFDALIKFHQFCVSATQGCALFAGTANIHKCANVFDMCSEIKVCLPGNNSVCHIKGMASTVLFVNVLVVSKKYILSGQEFLLCTLKHLL